MANICSKEDPDWTAADDGAGVGQYYGSGNPATSNASFNSSLSGPGRGRYSRSSGRSVSGRSPLPLGVSTNGSNAWMNGRSSKRDSNTDSSSLKDDATKASEPGIISAAIASAAAAPTVPAKGQENVSLLDQEASKKSTPKEAQFTFTCESESSKNPWSSQGPSQAAASYRPPNPPSINAPPPATGQRGVATQGTQTSPNMTDPNAASAHSQTQATTQADPSQANAQGKKARRRPGAIYGLAARQRRLSQQYRNARHPPAPEDVWICEFCEYESIFGRRPEALIRQYEIKDRKERKRAAEKQRLLEKAKAKSRKGKKATKNAAKAASQQAAAAQQQAYDHQLGADKGGMASHGTQSEEYLADEYDYDDEPIAVNSSAHDQAVALSHSQAQAKTTGKATDGAKQGLKNPDGTGNKGGGNGGGGAARGA